MQSTTTTSTDLSSKSLRDLFSMRNRLERRLRSLRSALAVEASLRCDRKKPLGTDSALSASSTIYPAPNNSNSTATGSSGDAISGVATAAAAVLAPSDEEARDRVFAAVLTEDPEYLHHLLSAEGCSPNCRDFKGRTPLHLACFTGDLACVELLVEFGAEINAVDDKQQTPREVAVFHNNGSVVAFLDPAKVGGDSSSSSSDDDNDHQEEDVDGARHGNHHHHHHHLHHHPRDQFHGAAQELSFDPDQLPQQQRRPSGTEEDAAGSMQSFGVWGSFPVPAAEKSGGSGKLNSPSASRGQLAGGESPSLPGILSFNSLADGLVAKTPTAAAAKERSILDRRMQPSTFVTVGDTESIAVCMVGLPGRGKSFLSKNCSRFLRWKGVPAKVFNAGDYRRRILGVEGTANAAWFDPNNEKAKAQREQMAHLACEDAAQFLRSHPVAVAFIDATNTNRVRRQWLINFFSGSAVGISPSRILFIESVCDDDEVITQNILRDKLTNGDYSSVPVAQVVADFRARIDKYREQYEPLVEDKDHPDEALTFLRVIDLKRTIVANRLSGRLQTLTASLITNMYPVASSLYIVVPRGQQPQKNGSEEGTVLSTRLVSSPEQIDEMAVGLAAFLRERCAKLAETGQRFYLAHAASQADPPSERAIARLMRAFAEGSGENNNSKKSDEPATVTTNAPPPNLSIVSLENLAPMKYGLVDGTTIGYARREWPRILDTVFIPRSGEPLLASSGAKEITGQAALDMVAVNHHPQVASTSSASAAAASAASSSVRSSGLSSPPAPDEKQAQQKAVRVVVPSQHQLARTYFTAYPKGESLRQVAVRTWSLIMEWKRCQGPLMYLAGPAHANLLLAFGVDLPPEAASQLRLPRCTIVEVTAKHAVIVRALL